MVRARTEAPRWPVPGTHRGRYMHAHARTDGVRTRWNDAKTDAYTQAHARMVHAHASAAHAWLHWLHLYFLIWGFSLVPDELIRANVAWRVRVAWGWRLMQRWSSFWWCRRLDTDAEMVLFLMFQETGDWCGDGPLSDVSGGWILMRRWSSFWCFRRLETDAEMVLFLMLQEARYWCGDGPLSDVSGDWRLMRRWSSFWCFRRLETDAEMVLFLMFQETGDWCGDGPLSDVSGGWRLMRRWSSFWCFRRLETDAEMVLFLMLQEAGDWCGDGPLSDVAGGWRLMRRWSSFWCCRRLETDAEMVLFMVMQEARDWCGDGSLYDVAIALILMRRCCLRSYSCCWSYWSSCSWSCCRPWWSSCWPFSARRPSKAWVSGHYSPLTVIPLAPIYSLIKPGVHTNDFAPIHRRRALKLGHASLATVFRPGRLTFQPILRENLESPLLRYQPITTAVITEACLNTRWHHGAYTSAALRGSLGVDRVVTMYVV